MSSLKNNLFSNIYEQPCYGSRKFQLYKSTKSKFGWYFFKNRAKCHLFFLGSLELIQRLKLNKKLAVHKGCVNSVQWNDSGGLLLSGSDDLHLVITNGHNYKVMWKYKTTHKANIFCAKFLPNSNDCNIISCSGDGMVLHTGINFEISLNNQIGQNMSEISRAHGTAKLNSATTRCLTRKSALWPGVEKAGLCPFWGPLSPLIIFLTNSYNTSFGIMGICPNDNYGPVIPTFF